MSLSSELIDQLVKVTQNTEPRDKDNTAYGTVVIMGSKKYVKIDGSDLMTPVSSTVAVENGDRVIVTIKSHSATITGNTSSPAASDKKVTELGTKISDFEIVIADKVSAKELDVQIGRIDDLTADNATIKESLTANKASIDDLTAKNAEITGTLEANKAKIDDLDAKKLDTEVADIKYASVDRLDATDANLRNLKSDYAQFEKTTTGELEATNAKIDGLDTKYANVDFSNIGKAAIEQFYATSGIIKDLVVGDQTITGELVGITISGDLIKGDTIVADKLVIKGSDGLYYKLNTDGVTTEKEQTEYNSLNGQIIQAKSITATKIDVKDLVAFGATIGGFNIGQDSIFSGVKETVDNESRGIYMDKNGQIAIGDMNNYIKYFKDTDGRYRLKISAASLEFNASGDSGEESKDLETVIKDINDKVDGIAKTNKGIGSITNYYLATSESSGVTTETAGWTTKIQNVSSSKKYLWNYEVTKYTDDTIANTTEPCIIGMYSAVGATGNGIQKITEYYALSALKDSVPTIWSENVPNLTATNKYMWNYEEILYTNGGTELTKKRIIGVYGDTGKDGAKGEKGEKGETGNNGKSIGSVINYYLATSASSGVSTTTSGWTTTVQNVTLENKYLWNYEVVKYSDGTVASTTSPCIIGTYGDTGKTGATGATGNGIKSIKEHYAVSTSNTVTPTSWLDDVPVTNPVNKYLWNYETITYTNGTSVDSKKRVIGVYGDTGKDGAKGADGKGIKSTEVTYQASTSGTVIPTGTWQTSIPTVSAGQYLWTRTVITYTDDSKSTSYSVGRMGTNGTNGTNGSAGRGIKSTAITYQAGSSGTTSPTGTWQATVPATSASSPYLWTRTIITYTDDTTSTSYAVGSTLEGISVGGRNLARKTNIQPFDSTHMTKFDITNYIFNGVIDLIVTGESSGFRYDSKDYYEPNTEYVLSYYITKTSGTLDAFYGSHNGKNIIYGDYYIDGLKISSRGYDNGSVLNDGKRHKIEVHYTTPSSVPDDNGVSFTYIQPGRNNSKFPIGIKIDHFKLEKGNIATDWTPAPEDGIASVDVEYYLSTSATALSGGSWSTTAPTWVNGKYMWSRTVTTDGAGNKTYSPNQNGVCIAGAKGETGATGATGVAGKGVSSIIEQYYKSTSATALSGGSWGTTYPGWENGKYIWTRSVITYTDKTTTTTTAVCVTGTKGSTGNDGKNATYITLSGSNFDTVASISSAVSYISINGTKYNFALGRGHTLAIVNPANGNVESIKTYDTFTDPTLLEAPLNAVAAGKIICLFTADASGMTQSARNILISCGSARTDIWTAQRITHLFIGMKDLAKGNAYEIIQGGSDGTRSITAYYTPSGIVLNGAKGETGATGATGPKGETGATGPKGDGLDVKDTRATNESPNWYIKNYPKTTVMEFKECKAIGLSNVGMYCNLQTIVLWSDSSGGYPRQTAKIEGTGKEYWRVGTSDTTWSSWIDPYGKSLEAAKTATNFMEFTSGTGLQIGDKTNGSWKGFRSRITSTAFEILNEAGTAVASYGRKLIQLGKDTTDAVIELCGGKGSIKHENVGVYGETKSTLTVNGVNLGLLADDSVIIRSEQVDSDNTTYTSQIYMTKGRIDIATFTELEDGTVISSNGVDIDDNIGMDIGVPGETETALSKARINGRSLLDFLHPVGSIYMSTNATNPTNLFGGTWVAWGAGRVPVGFNGSDGNFNSSEKTGGSKTINIQHNHGLSNARAAVGRADSSLATMSYTSGGNPHNVYFDREFSYYGGISGGSKHATDTSLIYGNTNYGGSTAASVLQPYIVCYMWKRTA